MVQAYSHAVDNAVNNSGSNRSFHGSSLSVRDASGIGFDSSDGSIIVDLFFGYRIDLDAHWSDELACRFIEYVLGCLIIDYEIIC